MRPTVIHGKATFTPGFKLEAVKLAWERDLTVAQPACDLGIHLTGMRGRLKAVDEGSKPYSRVGASSNRSKRRSSDISPVD